MEFIKFLHKPENELEKGGRREQASKTGLNETWRVCPNCRGQQTVVGIRENIYCCPACGYHFKMSSRQRVAFITDKGSFTELFAGLESVDTLSFPGYREKLEHAQLTCGEREGVVCGEAEIGGARCCIFVMEPYFMMGSMGAAVGEKICRIFEHAVERCLPVLGITVSGGARMQEGINSLMQMAKISGAVQRHGALGLLYLALLTNPTTGGVTASFAMQGDIILAEPGATVGFAGARVIEQTTRKKLPQGFQTAEFMLRHGFVDAVVPRSEQRSAIAALLKLHGGDSRG